jgi:hypothetical protein
MKDGFPSSHPPENGLATAPVMIGDVRPPTSVWDVLRGGGAAKG